MLVVEKLTHTSCCLDAGKGIWHVSVLAVSTCFARKTISNRPNPWWAWQICW